MAPLFVLGILFMGAALAFAVIQRMSSGAFAKPTQNIALPDLFYWILGIVVLGFNMFAYDAGHGIGWGIFIALFSLGLVLSFKKSQRTPVIYALGGIAAIAGLFFGLRDNDFVQAVNALAAALSLLSLLALRTVNMPKWHVLWLLRELFSSAVRVLVHVRDFVASALHVHRTRHPLLISILKTTFVTLIVLAIFLVILSQADPVFDLMVKNLREQLVGRTITSVLLIAALAFVLSVPAMNSTKATPRFTILGFYETVIPIASLILLLAFFLIVQQQYLFGDHEAFKGLHITYADYVRKGFIELIIAALIGGGIAYIVVLKEETVIGTQRTVLKALNVILVLALGLILLSALKRDWMYMEMYGLTRVRIIGEVFLAWVGGVLLLILLFALVSKLRERFVFSGTLLLCTGVVIYLNAINMDARIALSTPPRNEPTDVLYISLLSADAIDGWQKVIREAGTFYQSIQSRASLSTEERQQFSDSLLALDILQERMDGVESQYREPTRWKWQEWNWSRARAHERIQEESPSEQTLHCLQRKMRDYQVEHSLDLQKEGELRLQEYTYPFLSLPWNVYPSTLAGIDAHGERSGFGNGVAEGCGV